MCLNSLKAELMQLPLETLQVLFDEIINQKQLERKEQQCIYENITRIYKLLNSINNLAQHKKKQFELFDSIGCIVDGIDILQLIDNMTVEQLLDSHKTTLRQRKNIPIEETKEFQTELKTLYAQIGPNAYEPQHQNLIKQRIKRYYEELEKTFNKFGKRVCEPQFFNVIYNGLAAKELVPYSKNKEDIFNDLKSMANV